MTDSWLDTSKALMGLVLKGKVGASSINKHDLADPYPEMLRLIQRGKREPEELMAEIGIEPVRAAIDKARHIDGLPADWPRLLELSAANYRMGETLISLGERVKGGKRIDLTEVVSIHHRIEVDPRKLVSLSEVKEEQNPFMRSGFRPIDYHVGGLPNANLTVVGGPTGVGKTTLVVKILSSFVRRFKKRKAAFFSLEMTMAQIAKRAFEIQELTKDQKRRILVCDSVLRPEDIGSTVARTKGVNLIGVDFAELLLEGETSESTMAYVYLVLTRTAKELGIPIILVSQLSRGFTQTGGVPRINHLRYTGMAEQLAALVLLIYNPYRIMVDFDEDWYLPGDPDKGYLIVAKSRYGTRHGELGAIQLPWDGVGGWGDSPAHWYDTQ